MKGRIFNYEDAIVIPNRWQTLRRWLQCRLYHDGSLAMVMQDNRDQHGHGSVFLVSATCGDCGRPVKASERSRCSECGQRINYWQVT